jgi:hypothetical protein
MAAARKVSAAHNSTLLPRDLKCAASLPEVVVLPEPFTPTSKITVGGASA